MKRKIIIIGQGTIGTFLGAAFTQSKENNVFHFVRQSSDKPNSIELKFYDRRNTKERIKKNKTYHYQTISKTKEISNAGYIFVPVKHTQWQDILKELKNLLASHQTLVLCGNVLDDFEWFEQNIPCPYVFAFPNFGGAIINGKLLGWLTAHFTVGITNSDFYPQLREVIILLKEVGFSPKPKTNMKGWLMTHFAYNAGMLSEAARQGGFQKMTRSFSGIAEMFKKMREAMCILKNAGVDVESFPEGRKVFYPIWWNVLKTYTLFLMPGFAKSLDLTKNLSEWNSYWDRLQYFHLKKMRNY